MTASSGDLSSNKVRKLLERYHPREAFKILVSNKLSSSQSVREEGSPDHIDTEPRKIMISRSASQDSRSWDTESVRLPAEEEAARSLIEKWREGGQVKTGDLVGVVLYRNMTRSKT